jgi:hypothetical protein
MPPPLLLLLLLLLPLLMPLLLLLAQHAPTKATTPRAATLLQHNRLRMWPAASIWISAPWLHFQTLPCSPLLNTSIPPDCSNFSPAKIC